MDIFVRGVPVHASEKQLKELLTPHPTGVDIDAFDVSKFQQKPLATITILDPAQGDLFLIKYGICCDPRNHLRLNGSLLKFSLSRDAPSEFQLRTLAAERDRRLIKLQTQRQQQKNHGAMSGNLHHKSTTFDTMSLSCGTWTYIGERLTFEPHFMDPRPGRVIFGARQAVVLLQSDGGSADRVDFNYYNIDSVLTGDWSEPTVTLTGWYPPKFYRQDSDNSMASLVAMLAQMNPNQHRAKEAKKRRLPSINDRHNVAAGMCVVYQLRLSDDRDLARVHSIVSQNRNVLSSMVYRTPSALPLISFQRSMVHLNNDLADTDGFGSLPFSVRFQALRLAQNGKLPPEQVQGLLKSIAQLHRVFGQSVTAEAIRRLYLYLNSPPGPHTEASQYTQATLERLLSDTASSYKYSGSEDAYSLANRFSHIVLVHKINVTPAGTYLEGPTAEVTNRVLHCYPGHVDSFIRVTFTDEDGESVRFDSRADQTEIYHGRFKSFLETPFNIAGQWFSFLGFSHSSLRSQTCWFMSPFVFGGTLRLPRMVIESLGDFSTIRSPARCAARIGQAFTDTTGTVEIEAGMLAKMPDVKRNGRTFSDGCGTISESLLKRIWRIYGIRKFLKPTVLHIRFAGAKGVVSLDSRVREDMLSIRPSMEKFKQSPSSNIEICGAAFRPLPMILNRGYIKILEDLGVPIDVFIALQTSAVNRLKMMIGSTINAATFLNECAISKAAQLPTLLEHLSDVGLQYQTDSFLRNVIELAVVTKLRDMKYRGRIPVEHGVTLYGIMDETGYLQEDEIYVVVERPPHGGKQVLTGGKVIITRSPALHPGDIRAVRAVDVPDDSPLGRLSNCVVFSQHGARDLPSKLSGGDLDGDLYNVIFDQRLMPRSPNAKPADYPSVKPVELDRPVTSKDMSDFFVQFMETDQLGQISTVHVQLADQRSEGVFHPDCIKLAQMASTAVDFSKTGIPVS